MNKPRLRDHLQSSYLAAALACLIGLVFAAQSSAQRTETVLSGNGWKLWLDKAAAWENDKLFLPPVDLAALPKNAPTGGWESLNAKNGMPVSVPGTVEEYTWDEVGDYKGVSWWWRDVSIPESAKGKRVILQFESVRLRAEVFLNSELVCYDLIGNTPFEADITDKVKAGEQNRLAVRVTDPGGNFAWFDADVHDWGEYKIPASHGFGGITGRVKMIVVDPVYVSDIFVANKPTIKDIDVTLTINNTTGARTTDEVKIRISEASGGKKALQEETISGMELPPGLSTVTRSISVPSARAWDLENPNLYTCEVRVTSGNGKFQDVKSERFGFRWFAVDGVGKDAVFRMNGKRVVLRSAISWGFWPTNGIYATEELARKQVESAKALGQNMVNFHRCIGPPICFEKADEMGMFYFEEPGGYASHKGDDFSFAWAREKLLRMVKRDRNHPSLIIYNMINEEGIPPSEKQKKDMADAHKIDPSRVILYTSGWAKDGDDPIKLHMLPYDDTQYIRGWYDVHHALGPGSYRDEFYQGPSSYMLKTDDRAEIVFWGEEGAISSPPRLEKIDEHLEKTGRNGWDGAAYKEWYKAYVKYLDEKGLRKYFPSVDDLTRSMGNIPFYYQGRIIENIRTGDVTDGYVVNGWESELLENHSGIVDCFRNPKGDESIMAHYNSPLYVAVKAHTKIVQIPSTVTVDFFIVNEKDLKGACTLRATLKSPDGKSLWQKEYPVKVSGGDVFGELLVENVALEIKDSTGHFSVEASLVDEKGKVQATGEDKVFAVDWKSAKVPANGAILDPGNNIATFLKKEKGVELPAYSKELGKLDYIVAGDIDPERWAIIPKEAFQTKDGGEAGLMGTYFEGTDLKKKQGERTDEKIDYEWSGNEPFKGVGKEQFSVRWTGRLKPPETGDFTFRTMSDDGVRLWLDGRLLIDNWTEHGPQMDSSNRVHLEEGKTYDIRLEYFQGPGGSVIRLYWTLPSMSAAGDAFAKSILERVKNDGTTVLFIDGTERWTRYMAGAGIVKYNGRMDVGSVWYGGNLFVREHPLFKDLPVNQGLNWEYQDLEYYGAQRYGLMLEGEEAVAGTVNAHEPRVGTAVAVLEYGKGRIVLSTLDIVRRLNGNSSGTNVVRKIFCNYLEYAGKSQ